MDRRRADLSAMISASDHARDGNGSSAEDASGAHLRVSPPASTLRAFHEAMRVTIRFEDVGGGADASSSADTRERALQLLERTNQFNAWKRPLPPPAVLQACEGVVMRVADRYADYGIVGVALATRTSSLTSSPTSSLSSDPTSGLRSYLAEEKDRRETRSGTLRVVAFAMSCRVLGRGAEYAMLARLGAMACASPTSSSGAHLDVNGSSGATSESLPCDTVAVGVLPTERNVLVRNFLTRARTKLAEETAAATGVDGEASRTSSNHDGIRSVAHSALSEEGGDRDASWLSQDPLSWELFSAETLSGLIFDPVADTHAHAVPASSAPATSATARSEHAEADEMAASKATRGSESEIATKLADALRRIPTEARTVEQFMSMQGHAPAPTIPSAASGSRRDHTDGGLGTAAATMRAVWKYVLGDRLDADTPLLDDVSDHLPLLNASSQLEQPAPHPLDTAVMLASRRVQVPFGAYGGDSTLAVQLISLGERHGLHLPHHLASRLDQMSISQLLPLVDTGAQGTASATAPMANTRAGPTGSATSAPDRIRIIERDKRNSAMPLRPIGGLSACAAGDLDSAKELRRAHGWQPAHAADKHGNSALMWAAGGGHVAVVTWLLEEVGVAVDTVNKDGRTALMWACKNGHCARSPRSRPVVPRRLLLLTYASAR